MPAGLVSLNSTPALFWQVKEGVPRSLTGRAKGSAAAARALGLKNFLLPKIIEVIPRNIQIIRWNSKSVKFLF